MAKQKKITELTPAQEARLVVHRDEWLAIGLCTLASIRPEAEKGITELYASVKKDKPTFVWVDSPYQAEIYIHHIGNNKSHAEAMAAAKKGDRPKDLKIMGTPFWGQQDAYWVAFYLFCDEIGVDFTEDQLTKLHAHEKICKSTGWWYPFDEFCVCVERHNRLERDDQGRLHSDNGAAVAYPDGWGVYSWHGVRIPGWVITNPEQITAEKIDEQESIEVRRSMIEAWGYGTYLAATKAEVIDEDEVEAYSAKGQKRMMPRVLLKDKHGDQYLEGTDGSTERVYFMSVPNTVKTCKEAHEAISGLAEKDCIAQS